MNIVDKLKIIIKDYEIYNEDDFQEKECMV